LAEGDACRFSGAGLRSLITEGLRDLVSLAQDQASVLPSSKALCNRYSYVFIRFATVTSITFQSSRFLFAVVPGGRDLARMLGRALSDSRHSRAEAWGWTVATLSGEGLFHHWRHTQCRTG